MTVVAGGAVTADFKLEWINPGPLRLESKFSGETPDTWPIDGRNYLNAGQYDPGVQAVDGRTYEPGKDAIQALAIGGQTGRTTHFDMDEVEVMDETKGASTMNLPAEAVREVIVSQSMPELFQSLNAAGSVRVTTRSAGDEWHGNLFGNGRDRDLGVTGFPKGGPGYSRQQYGFGVGGAVIKDKAFLFVGGERSKQDGDLPIQLGFPCSGAYIPGLCGTTTSDQLSLQSAYFRENMLTARLDYDFNENMKGFARFSYDNVNEIGPSDSQSNFRNQFNVPAAVLGLDWNQGRFVSSARFGYQKMVNAINPALGDSLILAAAPFHMQIGSYASGAERGWTSANHTARPFRALRQPHALQSEAHDPLRGSDSPHHARRLLCAGKFRAVGDQFERTGCDQCHQQQPEPGAAFSERSAGSGRQSAELSGGDGHDFQRPGKFQRELGLQSPDRRAL